MARALSSFGLAQGIGIAQFKCGVTGSPNLSSVIMKDSSPPYAGSARRVRIIESRTQYTNWRYFALETSFSSIQKDSTDTSFTGRDAPHRESELSSPKARDPRFTKTMPKGTGSLRAVPRTPVTSPPTIIEELPLV